MNIYDYETLSTDVRNCVIVNVAAMNVTSSRFISDVPYTYEDLLNKTRYMKLNVEDQVKNYNRQISKGTLKWWSEQGEDAKKHIKPTEDDKDLSELLPFLRSVIKKKEFTFTRGNTFDCMITTFLCDQFNEEPVYPFWKVRDTRSYIDALFVGGFEDVNPSSPPRNSFIPTEVRDRFVAHDPQHDIAMDAYRMQYLTRKIRGLDEKE